MSKQLTLNLNASEIKLAVKSDSYITGQIDKSADMVKNAALAYNEQAGNEQYHEMKLYRTMRGALAKLEGQIAEYVETSDPNATISDNLSSSTDGQFWIKITVGNRTSGAFSNTMGYLAQEYIINMMLYTWWQPIKPALAKDYIGFATDNLIDIRRCLAKSAPAAGSATYDDISGKVQAQSYLSFPQSEYNAQMGHEFTEPTLDKFPSDAVVTYTSSDTTKATVYSDTGVLTLQGAGDVVITASYEGSDDYTASHASYTLHIAAA
jgi:hypothetical protein